MTEGEAPQNCPFCQADWGTCDHYRVLTEWEATAEAVESQAQGSRYHAHEVITVPPDRRA